MPKTLYTVKSYAWDKRIEEFQMKKQLEFRDYFDAVSAFEKTKLSEKVGCVELWESELKKHGRIGNSERIRMKDYLGVWGKDGECIEDYQKVI